MEVDNVPIKNGLARNGTRYSSSSSLSSAAISTSNHNNNHQHQPASTSATSTNNNSVVTNASTLGNHLAATAAVVTQTQGLNLAHTSRESPPTSCSPGASTPGAPTPAQVRNILLLPTWKYCVRL